MTLKYITFFSKFWLIKPEGIVTIKKKMIIITQVCLLFYRWSLTKRETWHHLVRSSFIVTAIFKTRDCCFVRKILKAVNTIYHCPFWHLFPYENKIGWHWCDSFFPTEKKKTELCQELSLQARDLRFQHSTSLSARNNCIIIRMQVCTLLWKTHFVINGTFLFSF